MPTTATASAAPSSAVHPAADRDHDQGKQGQHQAKAGDGRCVPRIPLSPALAEVVRASDRVMNALGDAPAGGHADADPGSLGRSLVPHAIVWPTQARSVAVPTRNRPGPNPDAYTCARQSMVASALEQRTRQSASFMVCMG